MSDLGLTNDQDHTLFFLFQGAKTGKDNGYTMLFDIEAFDYRDAQ